MKKIISTIVMSMFFTGCTSLNTIQSVKATGPKSDEMYSTIEPLTLEKNIYDYLKKCYRTSLVKMNGSTLGEIIYTRVNETEEGKYFSAMKDWGAEGKHYILIVSVENPKDGQTKVVSYSADGRGERSFNSIAKIVNGEEASCPFSA